MILRHVTTAFDLALIAKEALKEPLFCEIVSQQRFIRPKTNMQPSIALLQGNRLIREGKYHYSKAIGIKTGYHSKAKHTFVGAARSLGRTLIVVLLRYPDRQTLFQDAIDLFEMAFNQSPVNRNYLKAGPQPFELQLPKGNHSIPTYLKEPLNLLYYPAEDPKAKPYLYWYSVSLPIIKDQQVGEVRSCLCRQKFSQSLPLFASNGASLGWPHSWIMHLRSHMWLYIHLFGCIYWISRFLSF